MDKSALALIYSRKKLPCDQPPSVTQPSATKSGEEFIQVEHTIPKERLGEWNENFYQSFRFQRVWTGGRKRTARGGGAFGTNSQLRLASVNIEPVLQPLTLVQHT